MPTVVASSKYSLNYHLLNVSQCDDSLRHLLSDISRAAKYISYSLQTTKAGLTGIKSDSINSSGEDQLQLDVLCNEIMHQHLLESGLTKSFASEEQEELIELSDTAKYCVVFDPLDGSSLVNANFSIGTIVGIYENGFIDKTPRNQVAALYVLYGPRTILVYSTGKGVHEFLLNDVGEFVLLRDYVGVADDAKNFSPGNLRALDDGNKYKKALDDWFKRKMTLRYSGCMVADIHHIFAKGQGIFSNLGGDKYPNGKLRLLFECGPFAYLMEQAGGAASDGISDILDKKIENIHQRTPLLIGSKNEVEAIKSILTSSD